MKTKSLFTLFVVVISLSNCEPKKEHTAIDIASANEDIITKANEFLKQVPNPLTLFVSERSNGGIHDFYSEGDYWWPNPDDPDGPYSRRDGQSNPDNFVAHRQAVRNLNEWVSTLVAAYLITNDNKYAHHAINHLDAFFLNEETFMNPSLLYAQAIKGLYTGRGIGIIDTIHLIEVTRAIKKLIEKNAIAKDKAQGLTKWFESYAEWMNSHPYGLDEKDHGNNHSTWWAAQLAAFADLADRQDLIDVARMQGEKLLSFQIDSMGGFSDELKRTKPYIYMLFHLEGYATLCHVVSNNINDLWHYKGSQGSVKKVWDYMLPYIADKSSWPFPQDIANWEEIPIQTVGLLLAANAYNSSEMKEVWQNLPSEKKSEEIKRNFPHWQPILWQ